MTAIVYLICHFLMGSCSKDICDAACENLAKVAGLISCQQEKRVGLEISIFQVFIFLEYMAYKQHKILSFCNQINKKSVFSGTFVRCVHENRAAKCVHLQPKNGIERSCLWKESPHCVLFIIPEASKANEIHPFKCQLLMNIYFSNF
jgi:hypothetical protein